MKKLILVALIGLMGMCTLNAQKTIDTYEYSGKTYNIQYSENNQEYYIDFPSQDYSEISLNFTKTQLDGFIIDLKLAMIQCKKWEKIRKENNIDKYYKTIDNLISKCTICFHSSKWFFDRHSKIKYSFYKLEGAEYKSGSLMVSNKYKVQSDTNEYIDCKGFLIAFDTFEQWEYFITKISEENLDSKIKNISNVDNLFK